MEYLPIAGIAISIIGLLITYFGFVQRQSEMTRLQNERIAKIETKVDLFWKAVEINVGQLLKSPTHIEKDMLLDKLAHRELTMPEAETLRSILTDEMQLRGRDNGIIAYALIIGRLEGILFDLRSKK